MMSLRSILCTLVFFALAARSEALFAQQKKGTFETEFTVKVKLKYLLFLPESYDEGDKKWPMIVFLHGAGERGDDLDRVKVHGPPKIVEKKKDFPFIVLSPQCPSRMWWEPEPLAKLIDAMAEKYRVDKDRIYLTGLSMGGFGTWSLAMEYPHKFAAIAPICGGGESISVRKIRHLPVWVFHGAKDPVVPLKRSQDMVDALKSVGNDDVKFTVYPDAGHDSWTEAYDNPELYRWFLEHERKERGGDKK